MLHPLTRCYCYLILLLVLYSCAQDANTCLQPIDASLRIGAYKYADTAHKDSLLPNPVIKVIGDSIKIWVQNQKNSSKFALTLNPKADSTRYTFQIDATKTTYDTLVFYYTRSLHFVSVACGYTYYYNLNKITATYHDLDSVAIKDPSINDNATIEHVKLYY